MGSRSRDRIYGNKVRSAKIRLASAREQVERAERQVQAAACEVWSAQIQAYGGPSQPSPTIGQAIVAGYNYLELKCPRCKHQGSVDLRRLRRHHNTELWRLQDSFSCEACRARNLWRTKAYMVKLSKAPESHVPWYPPEESDRA